LQDIGGLVRGLKKEKLKVQVETNGTLYRSLPVDWYSVSPKPPRYVFRPEYKKRAAEVKLVVTWDLGFNILSRLRRELPEQTPILLQPLSNRKASFSRASRLLRQAVKAGIKNVRLSIQLHKVFGLR
jgi:organic radical activating enzyme